MKNKSNKVITNQNKNKQKRNYKIIIINSKVQINIKMI